MGPGRGSNLRTSLLRSLLWFQCTVISMRAWKKFPRWLVNFAINSLMFTQCMPWATISQCLLPTFSWTISTWNRQSLTHLPSRTFLAYLSLFSSKEKSLARCRSISSRLATQELPCPAYLTSITSRSHWQWTTLSWKTLTSSWDWLRRTSAVAMSRGQLIPKGWWRSPKCEPI